MLLAAVPRQCPPRDRSQWHEHFNGRPTLVEPLGMTEMVAVCESRADVHRYAWFTGRRNNDVHFTSLLAGSGVLTPLGSHYLSLPVA